MPKETRCSYSTFTMGPTMNHERKSAVEHFVEIERDFSPKLLIFFAMSV